MLICSQCKIAVLCKVLFFSVPNVFAASTLNLSEGIVYCDWLSEMNTAHGRSHFRKGKKTDLKLCFSVMSNRNLHRNTLESKVTLQ